jgi:transcriptional regulator with XRE-family HTH domain
LRLDQAELAQRASVSAVTVRRLESHDGLRHVAGETVAYVQRALEAAGVEFIDQGVRRRPAMRENDALVADLLEISRRSAARLNGQPLLTDADLYDENGLPH